MAGTVTIANEYTELTLGLNIKRDSKNNDGFTFSFLSVVAVVCGSVAMSVDWSITHAQRRPLLVKNFNTCQKHHPKETSTTNSL
eukprot:2789223-Amphidinium_carterae.1